MRHARHLVVVISVSGPTVGGSGRRQRNSGRLHVKIGHVKRRGVLFPVQRAPRGERHRQVRWRRHALCVVIPTIFQTVQRLASCRSSRGVTVFEICVDATGVVAQIIVRQRVAVLKHVFVDRWLIILFFIPMPRAEVTDPQ